MTDLTPGRHEHRGRHEARSVSIRILADVSEFDRQMERVQAVLSSGLTLGEIERLTFPVSDPDPSYRGLFICSECDEPWDTRHDEIEGCPYPDEPFGLSVGPPPRYPTIP